VLEVHEDRAGDVMHALRESGYADANVRRDLGGRERVVEARWLSTRGSSGR
jgi:methylase of polypeptide subunit release factors